MGFKPDIFLLPEDGIPVPKDVGDMFLIFT